MKVAVVMVVAAVTEMTVHEGLTSLPDLEM